VIQRPSARDARELVSEPYARPRPPVQPLTVDSPIGFTDLMTAHEQDDTTMGQNPGAEGDVGAGHGEDTSASTGGHPQGTEQPRPEEVEDDGGFDEGQRDGGIPGNAPDHDGDH